MLLRSATRLRGPERLDLGQDALAELVAGPGERERCVRVQALEPPGPRLAPDPAGKLGPEAPLLFVRGLQARAQLGVFLGEPAPALDAAGRLDPRDRLH